MKGRILTRTLLAKFKEHLILEERSSATIEKYCRDAAAFADYADGGAVTKELAIAYKNKEEKLKDAEVLRQIVADTSALESQKEVLEAEMEGLAKALEHDIMINISLASDQEAYRTRRESLESQWLKKREEIERLDDRISDKILRAGRIDAFIEELQHQKTITEFSQQAWG